MPATRKTSARLKHDFALQTPIGVPSEWVQIVRTQNGSYTYNPNAGLELSITLQPQ